MTDALFSKVIALGIDLIFADRVGARWCLGVFLLFLFLISNISWMMPMLSLRGPHFEEQPGVLSFCVFLGHRAFSSSRCLMFLAHFSIGLVVSL